jgi:hypothetical protein
MEGRASSYMPGPSGIINAPLKHDSFLAGAGKVLRLDWNWKGMSVLAFHRVGEAEES